MQRLWEYILLLMTLPFRLLPASLAIRLGCSCGWGLQYIVRFRRAIISSQLEVALGINRRDPRYDSLLTGIYRHLGLLVIELLRLPRSKSAALADKMTYQGMGHLEAAMAKGKGVIILTGHIGNWELAGAACSDKEFTVSAIGKEMKSDAGNAFIKLIRDDNGVRTIARSNSLMQILKALKRNELIVFMLDQNMTSKEGVFVDFFGQPACTMPALAVIAARSGAAVLPYYSYRDPDLVRHHCVMLPEVELDGGDGGSDAVLENTARYTTVLQSIIEEHPDQWLWIHKRWRTRPPSAGRSPFAY